MLKYILSLIVCFCLSENRLLAQINLVHNKRELQYAIDKAVPGTRIVMANGIWKDINIKFYGRGTEKSPIVLVAETPGKVTIEGKSDLKLGGEYLEVRDLYFKNGHTPSGSVIQFKINNDSLANHCTISNCAIDEYTQLNREITDHWVEFWGRYNRMDHCNIKGKSNFGPTVRVFLDGNPNIYNHHQIINNYFGPRPRKGGPHGETIQVGDSETSMSPSFTNISNNYFDRCDGEVEIISNKSNFNEYRNNVFFQSEGSLVLRHGNYCIIDGNIFIGSDNSDFMGGIRVINTGHWITNNYFYNIKGTEFRSAISIMNGIPKSSLNRYMQVTDAVIAHNSFIDCTSPVQISVGNNTDKKDVLPLSEIRSARPERTIFANNLFYNHRADSAPIIAYDKVTGVSFKNNIINYDIKTPIANSGLVKADFNLKGIADFIYVPTKNFEAVFKGFDFDKINTDLFGANRSLNNNIGAVVVPVKTTSIFTEKKRYGNSWFSTNVVYRKPQVHAISSSKELVDRLKYARSGDVISLKPGIYKVDTSLVINKEITITSSSPKKKATLKFTGDKVGFELNPKGTLRVENLILAGEKTQDAFGTLSQNMAQSCNLFINNTDISNFRSVIKVYKAAFADTISINNSNIKNCLKGIELNTETDATGDYNAEFVFITNSKFDNISSTVVDYFRGGYDESTIGGNLVIKNNTFTNCSTADKSEMLIRNQGIVNVTLSDNVFKNNSVDIIAVLWGEKGQKPVNNTIINSGEIKVEQNISQKLMY